MLRLRRNTIIFFLFFAVNGFSFLRQNYRFEIVRKHYTEILNCYIIDKTVMDVSEISEIMEFINKFFGVNTNFMEQLSVLESNDNIEVCMDNNLIANIIFPFAEIHASGAYTYAQFNIKINDLIYVVFLCTDNKNEQDNIYLKILDSNDKNYGYVYYYSPREWEAFIKSKYEKYSPEIYYDFIQKAFLLERRICYKNQTFQTPH